MSKHIFAFYIPDVSLSDERIVVLDNPDLVHRLIRVLRLKEGDACILFNRSFHAQYVLTSLGKKTMSGVVSHVQKNQLYVPALTFFVPVIKRDALSVILYQLVEVGMQSIQLVVMEGTSRSLPNQKEMERLQRVVIAAAEQSKNYHFPLLTSPISFDQMLQQLSSYDHVVYGDPAGRSFASYKFTRTASYALLTGPEADFSVQEKSLLLSHEAQPLMLTPTILRAESAATALSVLFRSIL